MVATKQKVKFKFTPGNRKKIEEIITRYPDAMAAALPALWVAQEQHGWVSPGVCEAVAGMIGVAPSHVFGVATFYTMYNTQPVGKYLIQVCSTLSCALMGARDVVSHLENKLGIKPGESTDDGKFTLMKVECLASCGTAPMMQINKDYYENLTGEKIDRILAGLE